MNLYIFMGHAHHLHGRHTIFSEKESCLEMGIVFLVIGVFSLFGYVAAIHGNYSQWGDLLDATISFLVFSLIFIGAGLFLVLRFLSI